MAKFVWNFIALLVCSHASPLPPSITGTFVPTINGTSNMIMDQYGRERYFHGTNVVFKGPPYYPELDVFHSERSFCEEDMKLLQSMGHNSIRLSVPWAAVEPVDGWFNETYISIMEGIVAKAGAYGIYTVIEFHQDAWNAMYCGNGAPDWISLTTSDNFPMPIAEKVPVDPVTKHPSKETCDSINNNVWTKFYFTYSTSEAVGNLYDNADLRDRFASYWGKLASVFASSPYVIGYELMNEPWCGDIYKEPKLLIPGSADRSKLQTLYDTANDAIRKVDNDHLILFQGVTWEVVVPIGEKHGFTHAPGGDEFADKSALTWHCSVLNQQTPDEEYFGWKQDEMRRLGVGGYVTEVVGDDGRLDILDFYKISWMQFSYKIFADLTWDNNGFFLRPCDDPSSMKECLITDEVRKWTRTYAKAVAGFTQSFSFNATSRVAILQYLSNPECPEPTVIFVSEEWTYPDGFGVDVSPADAVAWSYDAQLPNHFTVTATSAVNVTVTVYPL